MKSALATLCLLTACAVAAADDSRERIGLVLAGGGAKGSAHIGVLKVLEELRVPIDAIAGTSMGALVGGGYAAGLSADEMDEAVTSVDWNQLFDDDPPRAEWPMRRKEQSLNPTFGFSIGRRDGKFSLPKGAISGQEVLLYLSQLTAAAEGIETFDQLPIPFRAVATDLETGGMVVMDRGRCRWPCARAWPCRGCSPRWRPMVASMWTAAWCATCRSTSRAPWGSTGSSSSSSTPTRRPGSS
jgi:NTE family protein